jgi:hypothetical protein
MPEVNYVEDIWVALQEPLREQPDALSAVKAELESYEQKEVIAKFHSQWKNGKKGHRNPWNSWAAFYLGMTDKKPTGAFELPRRRAFARPSAPDIDSDFDYERRQEIIDFLVKKYGRGRVGNIGTYGALKMKSALTRIIKALDIADAFKDGPAAYTTENEAKAKEIKDSLPEQRGAVLKVKDENGEEHVIKTTRDAVKWCPAFAQNMHEYPEILKHADNVEGLLSIFGCVAKDTLVLTQKGWVRIDQLDRSCKIAYFDSKEELVFTGKYVAQKTGYKQLYRMKLDNGNYVDLTDEHKVLTDSGYVLFEEIRKFPEKYKVCSIGD